MKNDNIETTVIEVPLEIAREINNRGVSAQRINVAHATTLHERGQDFAISNACDSSIKAFLLFHMAQGFTPTEAIECFMELFSEVILPTFADIPPVREAIMKTVQPEDGGNTVLAQINQMLRDNDMEPILVGGTIEEIIEQLHGMMEAESQTKQ